MNLVALTGIERDGYQLRASLYVLTGAFCAFLIFSTRRNAATNRRRHDPVMTRPRLRIARRVGGWLARSWHTGAVAAPMARAWTLETSLAALGGGGNPGSGSVYEIPVYRPQPVFEGQTSGLRTILELLVNLPEVWGMSTFRCDIYDSVR
jgi:hypothetical protein